MDHDKAWHTWGGKQINWQKSKMAASAHMKIIFLPITLLLCHIETWFFLGMGDTVYSGPFVVMLRRPNTSFTLPTVLSRYNWIQLILGYALCMDHKCLCTIDEDSIKNYTIPLVGVINLIAPTWASTTKTVSSSAHNPIGWDKKLLMTGPSLSRQQYC